MLPFLTNCNPGGVLHDFDGQNCTLPVDFGEETGSWIASLFPVGAMIGGFLTGLLMPIIGRKWTMIGLSLPFTIGMNLNIMHLFDKLFFYLKVLHIFVKIGIGVKVFEK